MLNLIITYVLKMKADEYVGPHQITVALLCGGLWVVLGCFAALIYSEKTKDKNILIMIATFMFICGGFFTYRFIYFIYKGYDYDDLIQFLMAFSGMGLCTITCIVYIIKIFTIKKDLNGNIKNSI